MSCWRSTVTITSAKEVSLSNLDRFKPWIASIVAWAFLFRTTTSCEILFGLIFIVLLWHRYRDWHLTIETVDAQRLWSVVFALCALQRLQVVLRVCAAILIMELYLTLLLLQNAEQILPLWPSHHLFEVLSVYIALSFIS